MFKTLVEHQERISALMTRAETILKTEGTSGLPALGQARWELARLLGAYQLFKRNEFFDRAIRLGSPADAALARRMKADCLALGEAYRAYVKHWSAVSIADHWSTYQPAALAMIRRLRAHLATEREGAARLCADEAGPIRHMIKRPVPPPSPAGAPPQQRYSRG